MTYQNVVENAKKNIGPHCKVCKQCNGIVCKGVIPGPGGKGSGIGFIRNYEAFRSYGLEMDTIHGVNKPDASIDIFGRKFNMPIFAAPVGAVQMHYSDFYDDMTYSEALIDGCKVAGSIAFTGDGVKDEVFIGTAKAIKAHGGYGVPTIKPWRYDEVIKKIEIVEEAGAFAVAMDIDAAGLAILAAQGKPVSPMTKEQLKEIISHTKLPFIIKGIMTVEGAKKALEAGAYGIVVSNHGGRVLDETASTLSCLPEIVNAVKGKMKIFIDGGIRSGSDAFKAIALGADAVLIARPFVTAVYGGGAEGVSLYLDKIKSEFVDCMLMTGCQTLQDIKLNRIVKI